MKIYTKTGDKGKTSLFDGTRVYKDNIRVETYGTIDELNSAIGLIMTEMSNIKNISEVLISIQNNLFDIGAILANPQSNRDKKFWASQSEKFKNRVLEFENLIDEMAKELPELNSFILPGGGKTGALLQFARTVCRRTERRVIALSQEIDVLPEVLIYFNRLSDLLFTMSRFVNFKEAKKETIWEKKF